MSMLPPGVVDAREAAAMNCRFYENKFPEVDDIVTVQIKSIEDMGAYCTLLEYNNIQGLVLLSELSRRRIRSINKLIRVGRNEVVLVLRVDKEKGYIDLSKRRVSPEDVVAAEDKFNKSKQVHSIIRHTSEVCGKTTQELCEKISWPLYKKYGHAYEAFKRAVIDPDAVLGDLGLEPKVQKELVENIKHRLAPQPLKFRAHAEVSCFAYEGIDAVKAALKKGLIGEGEEEVKITLIAPPLFDFVCTCLDKDRGIKLLEDSLALVKEVILAKEGNFKLVVPPKATTQQDETQLQELMQNLQEVHVSGDADAASGSDSETDLAGEPKKVPVVKAKDGDDDDDDKDGNDDDDGDDDDN
eukprot:c3819_g1_i1.p1 GENE.c3819_g1_i1~~c3819_g1_i1.p1  ORF type:complete len:377 (-),score=106.94 c3819_g1_i1:366-1430(-)